MPKQRLIALVALGITLFLVACQGPMQLVVVVTATPDPRVIMITITSTPDASQPTQTAAPVTAPTLTPMMPTPLPPSPAAQVTASPQPIPTVNAFPTETRAQIYIVQQDFENGYMFWISTTQPQVIWVLIKSQGNPNSGEWRIYEDTFKDGEMEVDTSLTAPRENLYQPRRGFGKLWRNTPGLRDLLGWGTTPEFNLNTTYVYQPGGSIEPTSGKYVVGPGKHFLTNLSRQTFAFYESATGFGRWERVG